MEISIPSVLKHIICGNSTAKNYLPRIFLHSCNPCSFLEVMFLDFDFHHLNFSLSFVFRCSTITRVFLGTWSNENRAFRMKLGLSIAIFDFISSHEKYRIIVMCHWWQQLSVYLLPSGVRQTNIQLCYDLNLYINILSARQMWLHWDTTCSSIWD